MEAHAKYSPSKLSRILACPASGSVQDSEESSSYAEEGTMLHGVTELGLQAFQKGQNWLAVIGSQGLTREQLDAVEDCILYAIDLQSDRDVTFAIEQRVHIAPDCHGTADCVFICDEYIDVVDWKFGQGIEVNAVGNVQLMAYAVGVIREAFLDSQLSRKVRLHIIQPRLSNFSKFELTVGELMEWREKTLLAGLARAEEAQPMFNPSRETCRWCPKRFNCTARLQKAFTDAETVFAGHAKLPGLETDLIEKLLPMAEEIEACIKDLKLFATQQLTKGNPVKGFKLVRGRSNRVWVDEEAAAEFLSMHLDPEEMYKMKMVGPAAAEKLLGRQERKEDEFLSLIDKPEGKITLAPEADKRRAVSNSAEAVFANCANSNE